MHNARHGLTQKKPLALALVFATSLVLAKSDIVDPGVALPQILGLQLLVTRHLGPHKTTFKLSGGVGGVADTVTVIVASLMHPRESVTTAEKVVVVVGLTP